MTSLGHIRQDLRYALRGLRRSPAFTATVVLTLALGIGANTAMFDVIDQVMFRPYTYLRDPSQVNRVYLRVGSTRRLLSRESFPYARYLDLRRWTSSFSQTAAFFPTTVAVGTGDATRERPIVAASASFFDFFDARPVRGRFFGTAEDTTPAGAKVAVVSFAFWKNELGGADVLGRSIDVANIHCTIIGVAPEGFTGVADGSPPVVFLPITTFGASEGGGSSVEFWRRYTWDWAEMMVRRKPGITATQASADLTQAYVKSRDAARAIHSWMPRVDPAPPLAIAGAMKTAAGPYPTLEAQTLLWVTGVAAIVFLIACANVANLFLSRALRRRREVALRLALGVTQSRLVAQSLTESFVVSLAGSVVGLAVAEWGGLALRRLFLPRDAAVPLLSDWRTLSMAAAAAVGAALITGLVPILLADRANLVTTLKTGAREGTHHRSRLRMSLLVTQGALSVVLLVGAGLFVRSLGRVADMHLGYDVGSVLMVRWNRRGADMSAAERANLRQRALATAQAIPGVERAAWASNVPVQGTSIMMLFVPGIDSVARLGRFTYQTAGTDYFATVGTRVIRGRGFTTEDRVGTATVAVVSEGMARTLWPNKDALGQCIRMNADTMPCTRVVGVAEDAVHDPVSDQPLRYYLPIEQFPAEGGSLLALRVHGEPGALTESVRRTLQAVMPGEQYVTVQPMTNLVDEQRRSWRVGATMFVAFGALALVVAAVGLYGTIAYDVGQRMHELGVRAALGAHAGDNAPLGVGQGGGVTAMGVLIGSVLGLAASNWIQPLLFHESARDPVVFVLVAALLGFVALAASAIPAAKAARADPNVVLRAD